MDIDYNPTGLEFVTASYDKTVFIYKKFVILKIYR
jgi:hypothetical protein